MFSMWEWRWLVIIPPGEKLWELVLYSASLDIAELQWICKFSFPAFHLKLPYVCAVDNRQILKYSYMHLFSWWKEKHFVPSCLFLPFFFFSFFYLQSPGGYSSDTENQYWIFFLRISFLRNVTSPYLQSCWEISVQSWQEFAQFWSHFLGYKFPNNSRENCEDFLLTAATESLQLSVRGL